MMHLCLQPNFIVQIICPEYCELADIAQYSQLATPNGCKLEWFSADHCTVSTTITRTTDTNDAARSKGAGDSTVLLFGHSMPDDKYLFNVSVSCDIVGGCRR